MNVNEMTFGIEIECFVPVSVIEAHRIQIGGYHSGVQMPGFAAGWKASRDGSLVTNDYRFTAVEIVSPVLKGEDGLRQVLQAFDTLRAWGAKVNATCGFHVHVGWPTEANLMKLGDLVFLTANLEGAFYAATGTRTRQNGTYCRPIKSKSPSRVAAAKSWQEMNGAANDYVRYHGLNLTNITSSRAGHGGKPTVEFRYFAGTTNVVKAVSYIRMALATVEKALDMKRRTTWATFGLNGSRPEPMTGCEEMQRFYFQVGWTKGRTAKAYGNLTCQGAPSIEKCKVELKRLSEKYDAAATVAA